MEEKFAFQADLRESIVGFIDRDERTRARAAGRGPNARVRACGAQAGAQLRPVLGG